ncbi:hypothetical protein VTI74DRAFT_8812 [Chaetomium olivicolor]
MSSSRPAVTPATASHPASDINHPVFSSTPPPTSAFAGPESYTSPSPRTGLGSRNRDGDVGNPGSRSHYYKSDSVIDINPPAASERPSVPTATGRPAGAGPGPYTTTFTTSSRPQRLSTLPSGSHNAPPPRASSLLPPARIAVDPTAPQAAAFLRDPFNDPRPAPKVPDAAREGDSRYRSAHSRSSSGGTLSDTLRNLNRWSASTTSSRASNIAGFTRRVSNEILSAASHSPGKKLHKRRPSTSGGSPRSSVQPKPRAESPAREHIGPLQSLPQISTGPSLEHEVLEASVLGQFSPDIEQARDDHHDAIDDTGNYWNYRPRALREEQGSSQRPNTFGQSLSHDMIAHESTMPYTHNGQTRGHSRSRSTGGKGSADTTRTRDKDRERSGKQPSQKAMLSKALQKANTAVQLDNAQNFEGARRAYAEACAVLQQVLLRTTGEEDRRKLEAIHETYLARVLELDEQLVDVKPEGKALPKRPESDLLHDAPEDQGEDYSRPSTAGRDKYEEDIDTHPTYRVNEPARYPPPSRSPPNPFTNTSRDPHEGASSYLTAQYSLQSTFSKARSHNGSALRPPMDNAYMPPPLSPRRPLSPSPPPVEPESPGRLPRSEVPFSIGQLAPHSAPSGHQRANSHESVSWLDPIDESEHSTASSVHSRSSSRIRRKHIRASSGATEAEFDAALDDAIEAAYNDGYEPESQYLGHIYHDDPGDPIVNTLRRVEMARELVRESEREALELANEREKRLRLQQQLEDEEYRRQEAGGEDFYDGNDSDEEERLLEEMTKGNSIEDFTFGGRPRAQVPRESGSSGMTGRTWHSSMGSNPPTGNTVLTPVSEDNVLPCPPGPLPALPPHATSQLPPQPGSAASQPSSQSVRDRRLSGQNPKELTIETAKLAPAAPAAPATAGAAIPSLPKSGNYIVQQRQALSAVPSRTAGPLSARSGPSPIPGATAEESEDGPLPPMAVSHEEYSRVGTPSVVRPNLHKNYSASSLRSLKTRNLSISHLEETSDHSPATPVGNHFSRLPAVPALPAGVRTTTTTTGGLHLFENHFHSPETPGSPNPSTADAPAPLEPCPNDVMLRPFWLMRCLYQTLCHPRGGYISNKLFVPRDVWRVKGVKLKSVEDKIANCDLLTAALQKLARVDTCDADAVLEEMQALEGVLEQVQSTLARKLGSDVGVQGVGGMFRDANAVGNEGGEGAGAMPRSASVAGKGSSFSWRRLRSKNSSANLPALGASARSGSVGGGVSSTNLHEAGAGKDMMLASLPMTSHPTSRPTKRDVNSVGFAGPNANYMASLARLFDAAQTVDQIARQVEDPGLRHADKTQVGLELCTRHAAEFFAFYVCRFALTDLTLLLDKFVKRGSEWVLA